MPSLFNLGEEVKTSTQMMDAPAKAEVDHIAPEKEAAEPSKGAVQFLPMTVPGPMNLKFKVTSKLVFKKETGMPMLFSRVEVDASGAEVIVQDLMTLYRYDDSGNIVDRENMYHESFLTLVFEKKGKFTYTTKMPSNSHMAGGKKVYTQQFGGPFAELMGRAAEVVARACHQSYVLDTKMADVAPDKEPYMPRIKTLKELRNEYVDHMERAHNDFMEENEEYLEPKKGIRTAVRYVALNYFISKHHPKKVKSDG